MATTGEILRTIRRKKSLGQTVSDRFVKNLFAAELDVERGRALQAEELGLKKRREATIEKAQKAQERAATVSGVTQVGLLGFLAKDELKAGFKAGKKALGFRDIPPSLVAPTTLVSPTATGLTKVAGAGIGTGGAFQAGTLAPTPSLALTSPAIEASGLAGAPVPTAEALAATEAGAGVGFGTAGLAAGAGLLTKTGVSALGVNQELSNIAGGAVSGAVIGAKIGAVGGPLGAVIGSVLGFAGGEIADTIICTELHRQGYMNDAILELDGQFGAKVDAQVHAGYIFYAEPIVNLMRKSKSFTWLVSRLAMPCIEEMCYQIRPEEYRSNIIGKAIMKVGFPLCRWKGRLTEEVA